MSKLNKMIKYTITILLLFTYTGNLFAQDKEEKNPKLNIKLNASTLIGVVNPAVEFRVFNKGSVQLEGWGVYAPENFLGTGYPCSLALMYGEFRYYPKEVFKGFFGGVHIGAGVYRLNKNVLPIFGYLKDPNSIQVGQNLIVGLTVGYHFTFNKHWGLEVVIGYGRQYSTYESYTTKEDGTVTYRSLNGSAEYLPTKAGLLVTYRF